MNRFPKATGHGHPTIARPRCGGATTPQIPPSTDYGWWVKADAGITAISNGVTDWEDQWPNQWDLHCANAAGVYYGAIERPVWTPDVIPATGLPGLLYVDSGPGTAHGIMNHFGANTPGAPDVPRTTHAIVVRTGTYGGCVVATYQGALENHLWNPDAGGRIFFSDTALNRRSTNTTAVIGVPKVMQWRYYGAAAAVPLRVFMNMIEMPLDLASFTTAAESGTAGFSVGNVPVFGASRGFQGYICEAMQRMSTDENLAFETDIYLMKRAGLIT